MKIHEYQAVELFQKAGIPIIEGHVAQGLPEAINIAEALSYPVVLKAQVLAGGRGKAGGIKVVRDRAELEKRFGEINGLTIKGYRVEKILVVRAVDIRKEFYAGVTIDQAKNDVVLIASPAGGIDIEEVARTNPQAIKKFYLQGSRLIDQTRWPAFINAVFDDSAGRKDGTVIFQNLINVFFDYDCSLAEINPLAVDAQGRFLAADAKINFDDNALYRHPDVQAMRDPAYDDPDEFEAKGHGLSFVKLDGNVGCIVNGAGLAMATMDIIKLSGGRPANFLDVGGSSDPQKVFHALDIILRNKDIRAILINIFGGITRCDDIARGILEAKEKLPLPVPIVVRLTGTNEEEAKELLVRNSMDIYSTMREAVDKVVALAGGERG